MKRCIKSASENGRNDAELLVTDGNWELWTPHTFEASIYLARKGADRNHWARWDTAYEGGGDYYFNWFTKKGPLYIFINKSDPEEKYQYHAETDSFYNQYDRQSDFDSFICEHPAFAEFFGIDCNDVEACNKVTAGSDIGTNLPTFKEFATAEWEFLNGGSRRLKLKDLFVYFGTDKDWNASDPGYWYEIRIGDKTYKESNKYSINNKERCYKAMQRAVAKLLQSDSIEACDKVVASEYPSGTEFNKLCDYYASLDPWISLEEIWDMVNADHGNEDGLADDVTAYVEYYRNCMDEGIDPDDVETDVNCSTDTKYFANMVNAASDLGTYEVFAYYDDSYRALACNEYVNTLSEVDELVNKYANSGYCIRVKNHDSGTILEFTPDNWFNELLPDGGFCALDGLL